MPGPGRQPAPTRAGATAAKYHTARFTLVPALREELAVPVPADRRPGRTWQPVAAADDTAAAVAHLRPDGDRA